MSENIHQPDSKGRLPKVRSNSYKSPGGFIKILGNLGPKGKPGQTSCEMRKGKSQVASGIRGL